MVHAIGLRRSLLDALKPLGNELARFAQARGTRLLKSGGASLLQLGQRSTGFPRLQRLSSRLAGAQPWHHGFASANGHAGQPASAWGGAPGWAAGGLGGQLGQTLAHANQTFANWPPAYAGAPRPPASGRPSYSAPSAEGRPSSPSPSAPSRPHPSPSASPVPSPSRPPLPPRTASSSRPLASRPTSPSPAVTATAMVAATREKRAVAKLLAEVAKAGTFEEHPQVRPWNQLDAASRSRYRTETGYNFVLTERLTQGAGNATVAAMLERCGMRPVHNDGDTRSADGRLQSNNCLLISLFQHWRGRYDLSEGDQAEISQYRDILNDAGHVAPNARIASDGAAARTLVDLFNADPDTHPKLAVHVISNQGGAMHVDRLGSTDTDARDVVVWDRGKHFEPVVPREARPSA